MTRRLFLSISAVLSAPLPQLNYIGLQVTGVVEKMSWPHPEAVVNPGSLLKPFLALAYLATHEQAPSAYCRGRVDGCWYGKGHGKQEIVTAIANSCNVYFLKLAARVEPAALEMISLKYGLISPLRGWDCARLIGEDAGWPQSPLAVAKAFAQLAQSRQERGVALVLRGMELCSLRGTASKIGVRCYAKTGTAQSGFAVAMFPLIEPRRVLLASRRHSTGADVAQMAAPLVTSPW